MVDIFVFMTLTLPPEILKITETTFWVCLTNRIRIQCQTVLDPLGCSFHHIKKNKIFQHTLIVISFEK